MIIGTADGERHRYEIELMSDGFYVRKRVLDSDVAVADSERLFLNAQAAFAYASAAAMLETADDVPAAGADAPVADMAKQPKDQAAGAAAIADPGIPAGVLAAWSRQGERLHQRSMH